MCYIDGPNVLVSCGYEYEAYVWNIASRVCLAKLSGHRYPLVCVYQVPSFGEYQVITGDIEGNFRVWNVDKANKGLISCAQSISFWSKFQTKNFTVLKSSRKVIAAGYKIGILDSIRPKSDNISSADNAP